MNVLQFDARLVKRMQSLTFASVAVLAVASMLCHLGHFGLGLSAFAPFRFFYFMLNLNNENNLPTWFSSMLLGLCGLILLAIGASRDATVRPWRHHWNLTGAVFLFLSLDESASLHERSMEPMQDTFGLSGLFTNAWVLLALPLVAVMALVLIPFLRNLPAQTRKMFLISGAIYVGGAAGAELFSGLMKSQYGIQDVRFAVSTWVEETMEMGGIALFMKAASDRLIETYSLFHLESDSDPLRMLHQRPSDVV